jgi:hypothetical protein
VDHAGADRHIGTFDSREKAALVYEIVREKLKLQVNATQPPFEPQNDAGEAGSWQNVGSDK